MTDRPTTAIATDEKPFPAVVEKTVQVFDRPLTTLWRRGFRFLIVLDAAALAALMVLISFVRFGFSWTWDPNFPTSHYVIGFSIATVIHITVNYFAGLYEREPRLGSKPWLPRTFFATAIGVAIQGVAFLVLDRYLMPRLNLAIFLFTASFVLVGNRMFTRNLAQRRQGTPRVVLVGDEDSIELAYGHLELTDRDATVVARLESPDHLEQAVADAEATDVLLLDVATFGRVYPEPLTGLESQGVGFLQRVSARETLLGLRTIRQVGGMPFVPLRVHTVPTHKVRLKRIFDLVLVLVTAPIWLFALGLLALYVRIRAGSPVLYRQTRVGRDGAPFTCLKFRTMVPEAEARGGAQLATLYDDRIVPGLGWMRGTRADETPQLFHVVSGKMSLVGPRPERPELVTEIQARVPGYVRRNELPPGLTGLAQVSGRYHTDAEYKLGYDLQYLVNWSLVLDAEILGRTVWVVLTRRV